MSADKKYSILVVDDERAVLTTYGLILSRKGYDVETAISSVEALAALDRRDFDLLLCDYSLELEHTGFEVIDYGRAKKSGTKAAILTGYASKETAEQARQQGIAILYKPIDIEEFFTTIDKLLKEEYEPHEVNEEESSSEPGAREKGNGEKGTSRPRGSRRSRTARRAI
ncbi:MAG TPA: response regulator [Terriglobales bacterium]|nr:response regulator [Terriglobales bacterium]